METRSMWTLAGRVLLAGVSAMTLAGGAASQEGAGQSGTLSSDGLVLEWRVSGAELGRRSNVEGTWRTTGTIAEPTVRFSGVLRATAPSDRSINVSMAASVSNMTGGSRSEVRWSGELGKAAESTHELPFDLTFQSQPGSPLVLAASASRGDRPSAGLGVRFDLAPAGQ